jgi:hypothetical protein
MLDSEVVCWRTGSEGSAPQEPGVFSQGRHGRRHTGVVEPEDPERISKDHHAYRALWSSVLIQAVKDILKAGAATHSHGMYEAHKKEVHSINAWGWVNSSSEATCSFLWLCHFLGLDPGAIRESIALLKKKSFMSRSRILYVFETEKSRVHGGCHQIQ